MRRRFGRRRRGSDDTRSELDVARELGRVMQGGWIASDTLEPLASSPVPDTLAAVGTGTARDGERLLVSVSPRSGGDAWLGAVAAAAQLAAEDGFAGRVLAVSPVWSGADRRRLAQLGDVAFEVEAIVEPPASGSATAVAADAPDAGLLATYEQSARALADARGRGLFERAGSALAGLAAKHDGALCCRPGQVGLVLLGRTTAELRGEDRGVRLELLVPRRETIRLSGEGFAEALDRLEGSLRKHLADRRIREGDPGQRRRRAAALIEAASLRDVRPWPLGGASHDPVDLVGVDAQGRPVVAVTRADLSLDALGEALDAWIALHPALATLLASAAAPMDASRPRLVFAAEAVDAAAERVLACLGVDSAVYDVSDGRRGPMLSLREPGAVPARAARPSEPERTPRSARPPRPSPTPSTDTPEATEAPEGSEGDTEAAPARRFEEMSLFDLAGDEARSGGDGRDGSGRRRRRRRRGRGRSRAGGAGEGRDDGDSDSEDDESEPAAEAGEEDAEAPRAGRSGRRRGRRGRGRRRPLMATAEDTDDEDDDPEAAAREALGDDVPDYVDESEPSYDDDEDEEEAEPTEQSERQARRRARLAKTEPEPERPPVVPRPPRRRAAIVAHADRESIGAAVLLARDVRLLEGIWIYPQSDLMTFFRGVATDLREDAPIHVVGFTASPARDTLQAASLYRDRITWYDHHDWPPEDLEGLRAAIGDEGALVNPDAGGPLPCVLERCTRRSRFSDKLVDLITGRFSRHDYERWGRLWWHRLGELAERPGEHRAQLEPLLAGRPSDLTREATRAETPPTPRELGYVAGRDFRLVHFGGYTLVLLPAPAGIDLGLAARAARERYRAELSLAWVEDDDRLILAGDEGASRRALDLGSMAEHLASKFEWIDVLSNADHVARVRIRELASRPERLDEAVAEIAMGRSVLEG